MKEYSYTRNGFTFERIGKRQARTAFNNGLSVIVCACNLRPGSPWFPETDINKYRENRSFESVVNEFESLNCYNSETGKYTAFYIPVKWVDRFTGETPTAETIGTVKQYDYKYMEG